MTRQLYVIDKNLSDFQSLIDQLPAGAEYLLLEADQNGLEQLSEYLENVSELDALHLFSHGSSGELQLGNIRLTANNITSYQSLLISLGNAFSDTGDLLIYGCNVAEGPAGINYVNSLSEMTGLDVAASTDLTGAGNNEGDWELGIKLVNLVQRSFLPIIKIR